MKNKILTILIILGVVLGVWWILAQSVIPKTEEFNNYQNPKSGYKVKIPNNWIADESTESGKFKSRTVWIPVQNGTNMGNISQLSITVVEIPAVNQPFSTQKEFDEWFNKKDGFQATDSGIIKVENESISSQNAVMLKEEEVIKEDIPSSFFSYTSWFRKDGTNYYINTMGNGLFSDFEKKYFKIILDSFRLV
jgi:hypothetical protein